ncbi:unnamed protein product, partial [Ectocarpus sp. 12 AP-2014]
RLAPHQSSGFFSSIVTTPHALRRHPCICSMLGRGLYALQLQPWLQAFGRDQIKVLFLEEVVRVSER